jgi:hypothetical protein
MVAETRDYFLIEWNRISDDDEEELNKGERNLAFFPDVQVEIVRSEFQSRMGSVLFNRAAAGSACEIGLFLSFIIVLLVVFLGFVEFRRRNDLGGNRFFETARAFKFFYCFLSRFFLLGRVIEDDGPVLAAYIPSLAVHLCGVMQVGFFISPPV